MKTNNERRNVTRLAKEDEMKPNNHKTTCCAFGTATHVLALGLLCTVLLLPARPAHAGALDLEWQTGQNGSKIFAMTVDAAGYAYTTGQAINLTDFGNGYILNGSPNGFRSHYVWKIDPLGVTAWAVVMPASARSTSATEIAVDDFGNVLTVGGISAGGSVDFDPGPGVYQLTGIGTSDGYIHKLDGNGAFVWARAFTGGRTYAYRVKTDAAGNVYVAGSYSGTVDFDPGPGVSTLSSATGSGYVAKLDPAGNFLWVADGLGTIARSLSVSAPGDVAVVGEFTGTVDLDPGAGVSNHTASGDRDVYAVRLSSSGAFVWARVFNANPGTSAIGRDIAADASGSLFVAITFYGAFDADPGPGVSILSPVGEDDSAVVKLTAAGELTWAAAAGGSRREYIAELLVNLGGGVTAVGIFNSPDADFDPGAGTHPLAVSGCSVNYFLWQLSAAGALVAVGQTSCASSQVEGGIDGAGALYYGGYVAGSDVDPGEGVVPNLYGWGVIKLGDPPITCPDPSEVDYQDLTAADCSRSTVTVTDQAGLDAYLADFAVANGKAKNLTVKFNPSGDVEIISPCRVKLLGEASLIDVDGGNVCVYGRKEVVVGAGTPAPGSAIDATGEILFASDSGRVLTKPGIAYNAGVMTVEALKTAQIGTDSTLLIDGALTVTSTGTKASSHAFIDPRTLVDAAALAMTADKVVAIRNDAGVASGGDVTLSSTGASTASKAKIGDRAVVVAAGDVALTGVKALIGDNAQVEATGAVTLAAAGSATASDARIEIGVEVMAASLSQTAENKAVLLKNTLITVGSYEMSAGDPSLCSVSGLTTVSVVPTGNCAPFFP